ncbi:MAG TPA: arylamine N-acetyltransferase [Pyrinomonadaceae bacterium]|nr:arylamine N-acetyltransferase [Pyrinomonadaceae bacterium]
MNIDAYLERINYNGPRDVNAETLRALQVAHLMSVPFENLSIHAGEPIVLDEDALYTKIIDGGRGGFCYECNGLFAGLLRALGFEVAMLAAGVARADGSFGPIFDHMTLMVTLEDRWLVDAGFGDSFLEPLLLDSRADQQQGTRSFRLIEEDDHLVLMRRNEGEDWQLQYRFTLQPYTFPDYEEMCRFHQTSPDSHFTKGLICSRATEDGRITLSDMRYITTSGPQRLRDEQTLPSREEYDRILRDQFGVVMKSPMRFV